MPLKIDKRHGFGMIGIFVAILAVGLLMVAITRLLLSMFQGVGNLNERLAMQSIIQDQWKQMNAGTYEDFQDIVAAKGSPWTQSFGPKYEMKVEFGQNGKYVDAACDSTVSPSDLDRQCRKVTITITSKALPDVMESLRMTRVSEPDEKELLKRIEERIAENGNKFNTLYTKTESDARYVRYGMGDFACPWDYKKSTTGVGCDACDAPANDMQYRSGNCQLSTCPAGQMANEAQNGCETRLCPQATMLNAAGTACEACTGIPEDSWKQYYGANCSIQTCPIGQMVNESGNGCEDIVCPAGFELIGDECKCPSNQILDEASESCKTCSSGYKPNAAQTACETAEYLTDLVGCLGVYNPVRGNFTQGYGTAKFIISEYGGGFSFDLEPNYYNGTISEYSICMFMIRDGEAYDTYNNSYKGMSIQIINTLSRASIESLFQGKGYNDLRFENHPLFRISHEIGRIQQATTMPKNFRVRISPFYVMEEKVAGSYSYTNYPSNSSGILIKPWEFGCWHGWGYLNFSNGTCYMGIMSAYNGVNYSYMPAEWIEK